MLAKPFDGFAGWRRRFFGPLESRSYLIRMGTLWSHLGRGEIDHGSHPFVITGKQWIRVVVLCCAVAIINSMDRMAMSIAILPMSQAYGWSDTVKGTVSR